MANRTIPQTLAERRRLRQLAHDFVSEKALHPPVMLSDLEALAAEFVKRNNLDEGLRDWLMVEMHNGVWLPVVASIPRSDDINRFEDEGKTVVEGDPSLPVSKCFLDLAARLSAGEI